MTLNRLFNLYKPWFTLCLPGIRILTCICQDLTKKTQKPLLSIRSIKHNRKSFMQGTISTDEGGTERKEATNDPGVEDQERRWNDGSSGSPQEAGSPRSCLAAASEQPPEAEADVRVSLASPFPFPFNPTNAFHWARHPDAAWEAHPTNWLFCDTGVGATSEDGQARGQQRLQGLSDNTCKVPRLL